MTSSRLVYRDGVRARRARRRLRAAARRDRFGRRRRPCERARGTSSPGGHERLRRPVSDSRTPQRHAVLAAERLVSRSREGHEDHEGFSASGKILRVLRVFVTYLRCDQPVSGVRFRLGHWKRLPTPALAIRTAQTRRGIGRRRGLRGRDGDRGAERRPVGARGLPRAVCGQAIVAAAVGRQTGPAVVPTSGTYCRPGSGSSRRRRSRWT